LLGVVVASAAFKVDFDQPTNSQSWWGIQYQYVPLPLPEVETLGLESGIEVLVPTKSDQCWGRYPLCTPNPLTDLDFIGESFDQGIVS
jgi:hypothetical protein